MRLPRVRFTVRRMMVAVAVAGLVLGLAVEIPRARRRWLFCQERAALFAECARNSRRFWQREVAHLARTETILLTLNELGPVPQSITSLSRPSGEPDRDRWCFKLLVQYVEQHEGPQAFPHEWGEHMVSPLSVAEWYAGMPEGLREAVRKRSDWTGGYVQMARAYRRAAARPWEPLPHETMKP